MIMEVKGILSSNLLKYNSKSLLNAIKEFNERNDNDKLGCLNHGDMFNDFSLLNVSHRTDNVTLENNTLSANIEILPLPKGNILKEYLSQHELEVLKPKIIGTVYTDDNGEQKINIERIDLVLDK